MCRYLREHGNECFYFSQAIITVFLWKILNHVLLWQKMRLHNANAFNTCSTFVVTRFNEQTAAISWSRVFREWVLHFEIGNVRDVHLRPKRWHRKKLKKKQRWRYLFLSISTEAQQMQWKVVCTRENETDRTGRLAARWHHCVALSSACAHKSVPRSNSPGKRSPVTSQTTRT